MKKIHHLRSILLNHKKISRIDFTLYSEDVVTFMNPRDIYILNNGKIVVNGRINYDFTIPELIKVTIDGIVHYEEKDEVEQNEV